MFGSLRPVAPLWRAIVSLSAYESLQNLRSVECTSELHSGAESLSTILVASPVAKEDRAKGNSKDQPSSR